MTRVAVALGSNIDPEINLPLAVQHLAALEPIVRVSTVWQSAPYGYLEQPDFCNAAALIETKRSPQRLKGELLRIEQQLGRVRDSRNKFGPRTIDLDIALFGSEIIAQQGLQIPDPEIAERPFLAVPLAEILPDFSHPVLKRSMRSIAQRCPGRSDLIPRPDVDLHPLVGPAPMGSTPPYGPAQNLPNSES